MSNTEKTKIDSSSIQEYDLDLKKILTLLWKQRLLIISVSLASTLAIGILNVSKMSLPKSQLIETSINFNFPGVERGKYPNDSPFNQREIIANDILKKTVEKLDLDLNITKLRANLSLTAGTSLTQKIHEKINKILASAEAKKRSTPESLINAAQEALIEVQSLSNKTATLSLNINKLGISENQGEILIQNILEIWSNKTENQYGITKHDITFPNQEFKWKKHLGTHINVDALIQKVTQIQTSLIQMEKIPGIQSMVADGVSLSDLQAETALLKNSIINPLRSFIYENYWNFSEKTKTSEIQIQGRLKNLETQIKIKKELIDNYEKSISQTPYPIGQDQSQNNNKYPQNYTNLDSSVLGQMLELGGKLENSEFRKIIQKKRIIEIEKLALLEEELILLSAITPNQNIQNDDLSKETQDYVNQEFAKTIDSINILQNKTKALLDLASRRMLGVENNLFSYIIPPKLVITGGSLSPQIKTQILLSVILGLMLGILVALIRSMFNNKSN